MANRLAPKRSNVASAVPTTAQLIDGEMAVNTADRKIFQRVGMVVTAVANYFSGEWSDVTGKPTTLSGYGITDALAKSNNLSDVANVATARTNLGIELAVVKCTQSEYDALTPDSNTLYVIVG